MEEQSGGMIANQLAPARRLGGLAARQIHHGSRIVAVGSLKCSCLLLYQEGLIYRGKLLVNWDPVLKDRPCRIWKWLPRRNGQPLALALSLGRRQRLLGGCDHAARKPCWAIPRWPASRTRAVPTPGRAQLAPAPHLTRNSPSSADGLRRPAFGSGCVKITPAHDFND